MYSNQPCGVQNLLNRCQETLSCFREQPRKKGYLGQLKLGQLKIDCRRTQRNNIQFILDTTQRHYYDMSFEEARQWNRPQTLPSPQTSVHLLDHVEKALFELYEETKFGSLTLDIHQCSEAKQLKIVLLWGPTQRIVFRP